ncbi:hypothetical protein B5V89_15530 [Heyndrickxia sporothermodurans]|nr:hypothetical protein B5V89_15530 [Heyndrickxia sporothermodurans]
MLSVCFALFVGRTPSGSKKKKANEPISIILSNNELNKMKESNLINHKLIDNDIAPADTVEQYFKQDKGVSIILCK